MSNDHNSIEWTDARVSRLKELWAEGHSCSVIAERLGAGCSRNAIIGKAKRLGLAKRITTQRKVRVSHIREQSLKLVGPVKHSKALPREVAAPPAARRIPLSELTSTTCRWPMGDPKDQAFGFCGCEVSETATYCDYHRRVAASSWQDRYSNVIDEVLQEAA